VSTEEGLLDVREDAERGLRYELWSGGHVSDADVAAMVVLLRRAFPRWPAVPLQVTPEEHLRWKVDGPPGYPGWVQIVRHGERVVAQHVSLPIVSLVRGNGRTPSSDVTPRRTRSTRGWGSTGCGWHSSAR